MVLKREGVVCVFVDEEPEAGVASIVPECTCDCCLPYPALPLTLNNVFEVVKTVRVSWEELAKWLRLGYSKLDAIGHQHTSDNAHLKAVVEAFLLGEGHDQPSWRMLIHALHRAGETSVAEKIKTNAEPQQGEWVYYDKSLLSVHTCMWGTGWRYVCILNLLVC